MGKNSTGALQHNLGCFRLPPELLDFIWGPGGGGLAESTDYPLAATPGSA